MIKIKITILCPIHVFSFLIVKQIVSTARKKRPKCIFRLNQEQIYLIKEMISWIANIKELVDFETLDAFKRIGRPRSFFFTAMILLRRRVLYKEIGNAQIFKAKIHGTFLL